MRNKKNVRFYYVKKSNSAKLIEATKLRSSHPLVHAHFTS